MRGEFNGFFVIQQIKKPLLCSVLVQSTFSKRLKHSSSRGKHSTTFCVYPYLACLQTLSSPQSKSEKKPFTEGREVGSVHRLTLTLLSCSSRFLRALQQNRTQLRLLHLLTKNISNLKTYLSPCEGSVLKTFAYSYTVSEYEGMFI